MPTALHAQLEDPTRPPGHNLIFPGIKKATTERFTLSSVRISPARRSAVVNDRTVEAGDTINGAKVIAIYSSSVKFKKQDKVFTVKLIAQVLNKIKAR